MAINKKLIHFKKKEDFDREVANKNILDHSIVFIQDSKEISTHGTVYKSVNWSVLSKPELYEWVDLGLPSGLLWADRNVGAEKPEEPGLYFAWGETEGYTAEDVATGKKTFGPTDYKFYVEPRVMSKYNKTDGLTTLELVDDAAYYMSDGLCKMPSKEDFEELIANTTATEETLNDVKVWKLTSKVNGAFIFVPIKGMYMEGMNPADGIMAGLWSDTLDGAVSDVNAIQLMLDIDAGIATNALPRNCGMTIRPVKS